jgi:3-oxoacyl-[acyl-carrier-protein] synthase-3
MRSNFSDKNRIMIPVRILATGKALPANRVSAEQLDQIHRRPSGYTLRHGGVRIRHFASEQDSQTELAAQAVRDALTRAELDKSDIDLLLSASGVPYQALPGNACFISQHLGLKPGTPAFDINASCLSFLVAFHTAATFLAQGVYRRIAIVAADLPSRGLDWEDRESSLIFGDGAAAVILEKGNGSTGISAYRLETHPEGRAYCEVRAGGTRIDHRRDHDPGNYLFRMNGKAVFKLAGKVLPTFLHALNVGMDKIDLVVPHQASHLGMAHMAKKLDIADDKIVNIYAEHGNQVAASIPTALHEAFISGRATPGKRALLIGTAAGLSLGALVLDL